MQVMIAGPERLHHEGNGGASSPHRLRSRAGSCLVRTVGVLLGLTTTILGVQPAQAGEPAGTQVQYGQMESGQRVQVKLLSGSVFTGTVLSRTEQAVRLDLGGEPDGLSAWIELKASSIARIDLLKALPEAEVKVRRQERQAEAERALETARVKREEERNRPDAQEKKEAPEERPRLTEAQAALLRAFPPDQWGPATLEEIRRRWIVQGLAPNEMESAFVTYYPQWQEAMETLEAMRQWALDHRDVILLEMFPPEEGWSRARQAAIAAKLAAGGQLTEEELAFLEVYSDWLKAYEEREKTKEGAKTTPETAPEKTQEKPAEKPAENPPAVPAEELPKQ